MTSTLKVDTIAHSGGTTGLEINSGGHVSGQTKLASASPIDLTSNTSGYTFSSIPSVYDRLTLMVKGWSVSATAEMWIRLGTSGGLISSSSYINNTQYWNTADEAGTDASSASDTAFKWAGWNGAGNVQHLKATFTHNGDDVWFMDCSAFVSTEAAHLDYYIVWQGLLDCGGTLTQIQLLPSANAIDAGTVNLLYG